MWKFLFYFLPSFDIFAIPFISLWSGPPTEWRQIIFIWCGNEGSRGSDEVKRCWHKKMKAKRCSLLRKSYCKSFIIPLILFFILPLRPEAISTKLNSFYSRPQPNNPCKLLTRNFECSFTLHVLGAFSISQSAVQRKETERKLFMNLSYRCMNLPASHTKRTSPVYHL